MTLASRVGAAICVGALSALAAQSRADSNIAAFDVQALDKFVDDHLQRTHIPGVAIAITSGTSMLTRGYGHDSSGAPITADSRMYVASVSKSFTALAVMQLVEAGRLSLDKPVHDYLNEFVLADPRAARITVRQLLNQTSGMSDKTFFEWTHPGPATLVEAVARLRNASLQSEPGTKFIYHNPNYQVAARLVEVVSGERFADYMRAHIFAPLGMTRTLTVDRIDALANEVPAGHIYAFGRPFAVAPPSYFQNGAAGVITTANDMAKWLVVNSNGGVGVNGARILSAEGIKSLHSASAPGGTYGLGWMIRTETPLLPFHAGWLPTFTAYETLDALGNGVAVLSNGGMTMATGYEAYSIASGAIAIQHGQPAISYGEDGLTLDAVLATFSLAMLIFGGVAIKTSRRWAATYLNEPIRTAVFHLIPYAALLSLAFTVPTIVGNYFGDRAASWLWLAYFSPLLVVASWSLAIFCCSVLLSRFVMLIRCKSETQSVK
jgi:CubicO group peptidase (beta-lactamase class C family)